MSNRNLSNVQFHMKEHGQYSDIHEGYASVDNKEVGSIEWFKDDGTVRNIEVDKEHRRKGIATGLWNSAHEFAKSKGLQTPKHDSYGITNAGLPWAEAVGGEWSTKLHER